MAENGFDDDQTRSFTNLAAGTTVSHYIIISRIGGGGMGEVYLADDTKLKRQVALKFLHPHMCHNKESLERFRHEAEAAALFSHPNIVTIHDVDEIDERPFIVMEYVSGCSLRDMIALRPLTVEAIVDYATQICGGLECAHEAGVIHRDLKLSNILVDDNGRVRLVDFGLVAFRDADPLTEPGHIVGTASYMSPEQIVGESVDHRSDIFSFGIVLYELLTAQHPFIRSTMAATQHAIAYEDPAPPVESRVDAVKPFSTIFSRSLEKDRDRRYQSIRDLRADLLQHQSGRGTTVSWRPHRFRPSWIGGIVVLALVLVLATSQDARRFALDVLGKSPVTDDAHLAVLPFANLSDDDPGQLLCQGLRETLTSRLTQLERFKGTLWVVPASEVTDREVQSVRDARRAFGVNMAVTGSVQQLGQSVRLALNLVDTESERQVSSEIIDIAASELPTLQDSIVSKMTSMLQVQIKPAERQLLTSGGTEVPEAYGAYLTGRGYLQHYTELESVDSAIAKFRQAIELDSRYAHAYAGLGEAFWYKNRITNEPEWVTQATGNSQIALALNDSVAPVHLTLGKIYLGTGEYERALEEYNLALAVSPRDHVALGGMARAYKSMGMDADAENYFRKIIEIRPNYWAGYFDLSRFYINTNRPGAALEPLETAASLVPQNARDYSDIGALFLYLGFDAQALRWYERSIEFKPTYSVCSNVGYLHYTARDYEKAAVAYRSALALDSSSYNVWANLASSYDMQPSMKRQAIEAYRRAIVEAEKRRAVNPRDPDIISSLAQYYAMVGDTTASRQLVGRALELDGENTDVLVRVIFALENMGDRSGAIHFVGKALKLGFRSQELAAYPGLESLIADSEIQRLIERKLDSAGNGAETP